MYVICDRFWGCSQDVSHFSWVVATNGEEMWWLLMEEWGKVSIFALENNKREDAHARSSI